MSRQRQANHRWQALIAFTGVVVFIGLYAFLAPLVPQGHPIPGLNYWPDSADYIAGAVALLHGHYQVTWENLLPIWPGAEWGLIPHVPRYTPGMSLLLLPSVALGGVSAAVWIPYGMTLLLGVLAAWLAGWIGGPAAAPLAVIAVLGTGASIVLGQSVMSDIPSATLALLVVLLLIPRRAGTDVAAGILTGVLVWIRPMNAVLLVAGLAGVSAQANWRRRSLLYLAGAAPMLLLLMGWQALMFGSPFTVSYQAAGANPSGGHDLQAFFSLRYVFGPPASRSNVMFNWQLPNALYYPLALSGADGFLSLPGIGLLGLLTLLRSLWQTGVQAMVSRFSVAALVCTFVAYLPYYHQDPRFLIVPAVLCNTATAITLARRWKAMPGVSQAPGERLLSGNGAAFPGASDAHGPVSSSYRDAFNHDVVTRSG